MSASRNIRPLRPRSNPRGRPSDAANAGGIAYITFVTSRPNAFNAIYDPTVCVPGAPTETMAPLIDDLTTLLSGSMIAAGVSDEAEIRALWELLQGLGVLSAARHFSPEQARAVYSAVLEGLTS